MGSTLFYTKYVKTLSILVRYVIFIKKIMSDYKNPRKYLSAILFFISLFLLRHQIVLDLDISYTQAITLNVYLGWIYDILAVLIVVALAKLLYGTLWVSKHITLTIFFVFAWLAALTNVLYSRFFQTLCDWWIVKLHTLDLFTVKESVADLSFTKTIFVSLIFLTFSVYFLFKYKKELNYPGNTTKSLLPPPSAKKIRINNIINAILIFAFALTIKQCPVWFGIIKIGETHRGSVLDTQILFHWWNDIINNSSLYSQNRTQKNIEATSKNLDILAKYRDFNNPLRDEKDFYQNIDTNYPLYTKTNISNKQTNELKSILGIEHIKKPNVIVLFLESTRYFELNHPKIGPVVFPELRKILDTKALFFKQAYSPSYTAGQTVRGKVCSLCSILPNIPGPAIYVTNYNINIKCIQGLLKENGYQTAWLYTFDMNLHNEAIFETLHGTDQLFDESYYRNQGVTKKIGPWGLADEPYLLESVNVLESLSKKNQPFFAQMLTISTHHPFSVTPEGTIPDSLIDEVGKDSEYHAYLTNLRYLDRSLASFFKRFFESSLSDNTVVILMSDHSTSLAPSKGMYNKKEWWKKTELEFRIALAIISKNIKKPQVINYPVHQLDIAPTIATLTGTNGNVTWLGNNLLSGPGSVWVSQIFGGISYRTNDKACYSQNNSGPHVCFKLSGTEDPLFDSNLTKIDENTSETEFFNKVLHSNRFIINQNKYGIKKE